MTNEERTRIILASSTPVNVHMVKELLKAFEREVRLDEAEWWEADREFHGWKCTDMDSHIAALREGRKG